MVSAHLIDKCIACNLRCVHTSHKLILDTLQTYTQAKIDQDHFPERLGVLFIINAPRLFPTVWAAIKPLVDPRTVSKIQIVSKNYQEKLLGNIDEDTLPPIFGGTGKEIGQASDLMSAFKPGQ